MRVPLLRVQQKNEVFYLSRLTVSQLKQYTVLTFRYPYIDMVKENDKENRKFEKYINQLDKKDLNVVYSEDERQRMLQLRRLSDIADYISEQENFLPNTIILGCFHEDIEGESETSSRLYEDLLEPIGQTDDMFEFELSEKIEFEVIDGQHRLAGLFEAGTSVANMEIPVVILFGPSPSVTAKLFVDINGNQNPVDKSIIYDMTSMLKENMPGKLRDMEIKDIQSCHKIIKALYINPKSPLFRQVRMLGTGQGAVSQAFLVESIYPHIHRGVLSGYSLQEQFNAYYYYFKALQSTFSNDWPVPEKFVSFEEVDSYAEEILKTRRSFLARVPGIGTMLYIFPDVFSYCQFDSSKYLDVVSRLKGKVVWSEVDCKGKNIIEPEHMVEATDRTPVYISQTSKKTIKKYAELLKKVMLL